MNSRSLAEEKQLKAKNTPETEAFLGGDKKKSESEEEIINRIFKPTNLKKQKTMTIKQRKLMYDELWKEQDIVVIFGPPGVGKSTWAYQVGNYIAQGKENSKSEHFIVHGKPIVVGFFDFEDDLESITARIKNHDENNYHPDLDEDNFYYLDVDTVELWKEQERSSLNSIDAILTLMKKVIKAKKMEVVFIDNMTKIGESIEDARGANPFLKSIINFAKELKITLVMLAHTPKVPIGKAIELEDLKGSSSIGGAIDAAIGIKRINEILYVKQLKHRHTNLVYHSNNVVTFILEKYDNTKWLRFESLDSEKRILGTLEDSTKSKLPDENFMFEVYRFKVMDKHPVKDIADACNISNGSVYNYVNIIEGDKSMKLRFNKWLKLHK